jgi:hypothetical protein
MMMMMVMVNDVDKYKSDNQVRTQAGGLPGSSPPKPKCKRQISKPLHDLPFSHGNQLMTSTLGF